MPGHPNYDNVCLNPHAIDTLEADRDNVVTRINKVIETQGEDHVAFATLVGQVNLLVDRVPSDLKERLAHIDRALTTQNEFRAQVYKLVGAVLTAIVLAAVAFMISGGLKVPR